MTRKDKRICLALLGLLMLPLLAACGEDVGMQPNPEMSAELAQVYSLSAADRSLDYSDAQRIELEEGESFAITRGGKYTISGNQKGSIHIDAQDEIVYIQLDNVKLHSDHGPAILVSSAAKLVLTAKEATENTISDSAAYGEYADQDACVFSNADITVNGTGKLSVSGYFRDGIRSRDVIKILDAQVDVRAKKHGLNGTDGVVLADAQVLLQCENCGIRTSKINRENKGFVAISGGEVSIIAGKTGIRVTENLYIQDAAVTVQGIVGDISCDGRQYIQEGCLQ